MTDSNILSHTRHRSVVVFHQFRQTPFHSSTSQACGICLHACALRAAKPTCSCHCCRSQAACVPSISSVSVVHKHSSDSACSDSEHAAWTECWASGMPWAVTSAVLYQGSRPPRKSTPMKRWLQQWGNEADVQIAYLCPEPPEPLQRAVPGERCLSPSLALWGNSPAEELHGSVHQEWGPSLW